MRVLVLGAYGLIGSAIVDALLRAGHQVVGLGRAIEAARIRYSDVEWISRDLRRLTKPDDWVSLLSGIDAVVNAAGVLQDGPGDDVVAVHRQQCTPSSGVARGNVFGASCRFQPRVHLRARRRVL